MPPPWVSSAQLVTKEGGHTPRGDPLGGGQCLPPTVVVCAEQRPPLLNALGRQPSGTSSVVVAGTASRSPAIAGTANGLVERGLGLQGPVATTDAAEAIEIKIS